jgi:hypothetical protein
MINERVEVYYNIRKKCLSVRSKGKVISHPINITLRQASFHVSEAGRQRVITQKRKNVHAVVRGKIISFDAPREIVGTRVTYNPYKYKTFVREDGSPIHQAFEVAIAGNVIQIIEDQPFSWPKGT